MAFKSSCLNEVMNNNSALGGGGGGGGGGGSAGAELIMSIAKQYSNHTVVYYMARS